MKITITNQRKQTKVTGIHNLTRGVWRTNDVIGYVVIANSKPTKGKHYWDGCIMFEDGTSLFSHIGISEYWVSVELVQMSDDFELKLSE